MKEQTPTDADLPVGGFSRRTLLGGMALGVAAAAAPTLVHPGAAAAAPTLVHPGAAVAAPYLYPFRNPHLPLEKRIDDLIGRLTLAERVSLLHQYQVAIPRLDIPLFKTGTEALHGIAWSCDYNNNGNVVDASGTVFPQGVGLGCTWDPDLLRQVGDVVGHEARGYNSENPVVWGLNLWAPVVNLLRDPRWGRNEEGYSEDPYLTGQMSTAYGSGIQGPDPEHLLAAPTLKHFMAYNNEANRTSSSSVVRPRVLREYDEKAFEPAIAANAVTGVMTSYNLINGRPATVCSYINDDLRHWSDRELAVMSDAGAPSNLVYSQNYYPNAIEADAAAILAGLDSFTQDSQLPGATIAAITAALQQGLVTEADINVPVRNLLAMRFRLGEFDPAGVNPYASITSAAINTPENQKLARRAVQAQMVLLKNDQGLLPLRKSAKVALLGPLCDQLFTDFYAGIMPYRITPVQGVREAQAGQGGSVQISTGVDQIALQAPNGKYVTASTLTSGAQLTATADTVGTDETFDLFDWGQSVVTVRARSNNRYWTRGSGNAVINSEVEPNGWSPQQTFTFVQQTDGTYTIRQGSGSSNYIVVNATTGALTANGRSTAATHFTQQIVVRGIDQAVAAAAAADVAVLVIGNDPMVIAKEAVDRQDLNLPPQQEALIAAVTAANPKTVVIVESSYPYAITWAQANTPAILYSAHGGQETGHGFADVLFGDYAPAGRLSQTWYQSAADLPSIFDYDIIKDNRTYLYFEGVALYPFGHGLTYPTFSYRNLRLSPARINANGHGGTRISVEVTNSGSRDSDEVVQLYTHQRESRVKQPRAKLRDFQRLHFRAGEKKTVTFTLEASELAFWDVTRGKWVVESATHDIMVGRSSADIAQSAVLRVDGEVIPPRDLIGHVTQAEDFDDYSGVTLVDVSKTTGDAVHQTASGGWIKFQDADLRSGAGSLLATVAKDDTVAANIQILLDDPVTGTVVGTLPVPTTGDRYTYTTATTALSGARGRHDVYLVFNGNAYLDSFTFSR